MRLVVLGLSLSSSWGNGHATTYRALLRAMAARGHEILFLERDKPWYAAQRDLPDPAFCRLAFYDGVEDLHRQRLAIAGADAVIVGSYVPDGAAVIDLIEPWVRGTLCFYDIDTPVTLRMLTEGRADYLAARQIPLFDLYLSFTGGPTLRHLERRYGARRARALYCGVDERAYRPRAVARRWRLGYLGTYSADRQPKLDALLLSAALLMPRQRFVVAGPQYPATIAWPRNVERIEHLSPADHPAFYAAQDWTLNLTRADMVACGYSPSVRLFEATACGTAVMSDRWPGLDTIFEPGSEVALVRTVGDVLQTLAMTPAQRDAIANAGRDRTLLDHTAGERARELEKYLAEARGRPALGALTVGR
jgi:spore maturation protein CgeB